MAGEAISNGDRERYVLTHDELYQRWRETPYKLMIEFITEHRAEIDAGIRQAPRNPVPGLGLTGTIVIRHDDDSAVPLTGRVVREVDQDRLEVVWGSGEVSCIEYFDELAPYRGHTSG